MTRHVTDVTDVTDPHEPPPHTTTEEPPMSLSSGTTTSVERVLLTVTEVAHALSVGRSKVFDLIAAGEIGSVKIGKLRRVPVDEVRDYAARLFQQQGNG